MTSAWTAGVVAVVAAASVAATPAQGPAPAPVSCAYTVTTWSGGFMANIALVNHGPTISGWTVRWSFAEPTGVVGTWSSLISQQGAEVTATNLAWNGVIATGAEEDFGWSAVAGSTTVPTDLTVNGVPC